MLLSITTMNIKFIKEPIESAENEIIRGIVKKADPRIKVQFDGMKIVVNGLLKIDGTDGELFPIEILASNEWKTVIDTPVSFINFAIKNNNEDSCFVAYCLQQLFGNSCINDCLVVRKNPVNGNCTRLYPGCCFLLPMEYYNNLPMRYKYYIPA